MSPGVVKDAGVAAAGFLNTLGITASGPAFCINTGPTTGAYNQLCLGATQTGGATLSLFGINGATGGFTININGSQITFPFIAPGTGILGPVSTITGDTMCWGNTTGTQASDCGFGDLRVWAGVSTGTNAINVTITNYPGYIAGQSIRFKAGASNTGATTFNINGLGDITLAKQTPGGFQNMASGDIITAQVYTVMYDGTVFLLIGGAAPVLPTVKAFTSVHTVAAIECGQYQIYSGGFYGIIFATATAYPTNCQVTVKNTDTSRGKFVTVSGLGTIRLYPGTQVTLTRNGSAWVQDPQTLFWDGTGVTWYWAASGGSDNPAIADCMSSSSPCATAQNIINLIAASVPGNGGATIQFNCDGVYAQGTQIVRTFEKLITFVGDLTTPSNCPITVPNGTVIFDIQDGAQVVISGFQLGYSSGGGSSVNARQFALVDVASVSFASNTGGVQIGATDVSSVNVQDVTVVGNSAIFLAASANSSVQFNLGFTVPALTSVNVGILIDAINAEISGTPVYSISGTIAGQQFACGSNAVIGLGTAYPAALTAGASSTGCQHIP